MFQQSHLDYSEVQSSKKEARIREKQLKSSKNREFIWVKIEYL